MHLCRFLYCTVFAISIVTTINLINGAVVVFKQELIFFLKANKIFKAGTKLSLYTYALLGLLSGD